MSSMKKLSEAWWIGDHAGSANLTRPLLLWGLTYGVVADFLNLVQPQSAQQLWAWPTFTSPDVRFILWAMAYQFRAQKMDLVNRELQIRTRNAQDSERGSQTDMKADQTFIESNGKTSSAASPRPATVGFLLEGYYDLVRKGVAVSLLARFLSLAAIAAYFFVSK